ncbi:MAG: hotdog fold domain-containing protein [Lysobacterales bacterium]
MASALSLWRSWGGSGIGRWLFARAICFKAPYFATIAPRFLELAPGRCVVQIHDRRRVHNHIGTVHAIALCNLAELTAGLATDAAVRPDQRWIPKGMTVAYLKKATGTLTGTASIAGIRELNQAGEAIADVQVVNAAGEPVFSARVTMWVSPKAPAA